MDGAHERLRRTFDEVAELYDRARPTYPAPLFDDLCALGGLEPGACVLEIGPGTGQATAALAERGLRVVAVELGERLAAVARSRLAHLPGVEVVVADAERWPPAPAAYDAVAAFTSIHWLDAAVRWQRPAALLRPHGALAVVTTDHVRPAGGDAFFGEVQADYVALGLSDDDEGPGPPELVPDLAAEIAASGAFEPAAVRRYTYDVAYDAEAYIAVLDTYSGHRTLPADVREALYSRVRGRIAARPGGTVRKSYLATLHVARRRAG